jgi:hypothetical protein
MRDDQRACTPDCTPDSQTRNGDDLDDIELRLRRITVEIEIGASAAPPRNTDSASPQNFTVV